MVFDEVVIGASKKLTVQFALIIQSKNLDSDYKYTNNNLAFDYLVQKFLQFFLFSPKLNFGFQCILFLLYISF